MYFCKYKFDMNLLKIQIQILLDKCCDCPEILIFLVSLNSSYCKHTAVESD